jgi:isoaspartyl peptidase/L-asparaginase-like protein (Ntn-hydrolase superfamily)
VVLAGVLTALACEARPVALGEVPPATATAEPDAIPMVVAHGGQGSPADRSDGPAAAAARALEALDAGRTAEQAAIAGVMVLEDDPRFNAGIGSNLRLDGRTVECDAAIMDDTGRFGAVSGVTGIRNPILAAAAVADSPHQFLAGPGADAFARTLALPEADLRTDRARARLAAGVDALAADRVWRGFDWRARWNFPTPPPASGDEVRAGGEPEPIAPRDTVGVVVRTADGHYVAALSTGGTALALRGRVGDVPQLGAGLYAGPAGAVATTGLGEAITRERLAAEVYRLLERDVEPTEAIRRAARRISRAEGVGAVAVSRRGFGAWATTQMAWAATSPDGTVRADTVIHR